MKISYDSSQLIEDVSNDILLFGESFKVYAVYSYREDFDFEYISDYVDADEPIRDEVETEKEFLKVLKDYKKPSKYPADEARKDDVDRVA